MVELISINYKILNNSDIEKNTYLFYLVFRNVHIKTLIFQHLKFFNIHYHQRTFNLENFCAYPFKKYLGSMKLVYSNDHEKLVTFLNHLPPTVKSIELHQLGTNKNDNDSFQVGCFKNSITSLKLNYWFNQNLEKGVIGSNIQSLTMGKSFNKSLVNSLPSIGLTYLDLGFDFNSIIEPNVLPKTLKTLILSERFNQKLLVSSLPDLEVIEFGGCYNRSILPHALPESLTSISFGYSFNKRISIDIINNNEEIKYSVTNNDQLNNNSNELNNNNINYRVESLLPSKNLKSIRFGSKFDKFIEVGVLPIGLEKIEFSIVGDFNQPIVQGTIPNTVKSIQFPSQFNQPIRIDNLNCIPDSVTVLKFGRYFQQPIYKLSIPNSVTDLCIGGIDSNQVILQGQIPESVVKLKVGENQIFRENSLPSSITSIEGLNAIYIKEIPEKVRNFTFLNANDPIEFLQDIPDNIVSIDVGGLFDNREFERSIIPNHITSLTFGSQFNQRILPSFLHNVIGLKQIKFGYYYNQIIFPCSLPDTITILQFDQRFNQCLSASTLPKNLKSIIINGEYNQIIKSNSLPATLLSLRLNCKYFNQVICSQVLPSSIKLLELPTSISNQQYSSDWLPASLEHLIVHGSPEFKLPLPDNLKFIYVKNSNHVFLDSISNYGSQFINRLKVIEENIFNNLFYYLNNKLLNLI